jgi:hypothetical protein
MAREYEIARPTGLCHVCQKALVAGQDFMAAVFDVGKQFRRDDTCLPCWQEKGRPAEAFSVWQGRVPEKSEPKKVYVDDEVLKGFFERLEGEAEPAKIQFRYVLALMLMRKRLLAYDSDATVEGVETWRMHFRGQTAVVEVVNPHLTEEQVAEVAAQVGAIFENPA